MYALIQIDGWLYVLVQYSFLSVPPKKKIIIPKQMSYLSSRIVKYICRSRMLLTEIDQLLTGRIYVMKNVIPNIEAPRMIYDCFILSSCTQNL